MWSGGRSLRIIAVAGGLALSGTAPGQTPLCNGQHPGNPELISGAASCFYNEVNGGQTLIQLNGNSIIRWDHLGLSDPGSNLSFEWNGAPPPNASVLNRVEGVPVGRVAPAEIIRGSVTFADGNLIVNHPNSLLTISGMVSARSLLFSTHHVDPVMEHMLLCGNETDLTGSAHDLEVIDGQVIATDGDAILAGKRVTISAMMNPADTGSEVRALNGSVRVFGGENFRLLSNGPQRLQRLPGGDGEGFVNNSKTIIASQDVEIVAEGQILNNGRIEADFQSGQAFLRVDMGGNIINHNIIQASAILPLPDFGEGVEITPNTDSPSPLSTGMSRFPVVRSPGEKQSSRKVVVYENAPSTGTASAQRQRTNRKAEQTTRRNTQVASNSSSRTGTRGKHLARGKSFFGVRGVSRAKKD